MGSGKLSEAQRADFRMSGAILLPGQPWETVTFRTSGELSRLALQRGAIMYRDQLDELFVRIDGDFYGWPSAGRKALSQDGTGETK